MSNEAIALRMEAIAIWFPFHQVPFELLRCCYCIGWRPSAPVSLWELTPPLRNSAPHGDILLGEYTTRSALRCLKDGPQRAVHLLHLLI